MSSLHMQLALEQHRCELGRSIYMEIFFPINIQKYMYRTLCERLVLKWIAYPYIRHKVSDI